ncbi:hypothetical protein K505DRAFT_343799 [Melanomma pulvis-pyrius CBS 109.77]|uniref:CFEM domain-containing protein n=1 Tax=Melanomma pulvis-pyrius CBS 109.77 TaxID=1314802 RepID=A0A6A6WQT6_9PLEO|nr:hypothetical protein K505DRAFT_343799 [Melanomma pulvis-pyrius CBS 109.77]
MCQSLHAPPPRHGTLTKPSTLLEPSLKNYGAPLFPSTTPTVCARKTWGNGLGPRTLSIDDIPPCGIQCLVLAVPTSGCSLTDVQCQCQSEQLADTLSACMLANCTMAESLDTAVVQADLCNMSNESKTGNVVLCTSIVFSIAVIFVGLRITGKVLAKRITPDDWVIVAALLLAALPCGCVLGIFISWSTYVLVLGLIKISLVMFYLQIFISHRFRIIAYIVLTYIALSTIGIYLVTIFSCSPVNSFWDRDVKGKCLDINAVAYANSGSAIAQDIIILVLPLASVRKLKTNKYRKIAVGIMFAVGTFGCITTILRLHSLLDFRISIDPTWDYVPVTIWTELELASGFVCVSLPAIRILLTMMLPRNLLNSMTSRRSRSNSTPQLHNHHNEREERSARKGYSWMHIPTTTDSDIGTGLGELKSQGRRRSRSMGNGFWPSGIRSENGSQALATFGTVDTPSTQHLTQYRDQHSHTATPTPTVQFDNYLSEEDRLQRPQPVLGRTGFCNSCGSQAEVITQLPNLGCLPDGSYSGDSGVGRRVRHGYGPGNGNGNGKGAMA